MNARDGCQCNALETSVASARKRNDRFAIALALAALVRLDTRFRLSWLLLGTFLIYWLARFFLDGMAFRQLAA